MNILFDIVHPAHVHFFKHMIRALEARGHHTTIVARDKDVTADLLAHEGFPFETVPRARQKGRLHQFRELARRDFVLARHIHRHDVDLVVTRNPAGVQAARAMNRIGIFDTDDGSAAGVHFQAARPFATVLTSPDCLDENWGPRHVKYQGYKQSAYLHPNHFTPDPTVLAEVGLDVDEPFFLVRFVAMGASHDHGEAGLSLEVKRALIKRLTQEGKVLLSCESAIPDEWAHLGMTLPAHRMHDLLAFARLIVGDSQTMAAEAAVLGTPSLRASTFVGRISYLEELEHRYGLTRAFHPRDGGDFLAALEDMLAKGSSLRASLAPGHARMMAEKIDIAAWYTDFIERRGRGS